MKPGDLVRVRPDIEDTHAGEIGIIIALLDLESYFNPYEVLLSGTRRFYGEKDLIILSEKY